MVLFQKNTPISLKKTKQVQTLIRYPFIDGLCGIPSYLTPNKG